VSQSFHPQQYNHQACTHSELETTTLSDNVSNPFRTQKPTPALVFITQTGPVQSKNVQTQIRKHIMRDIGKSRRKDARHKKLPPLQFSLEIPASINDFHFALRAKELDPIQASDSLLEPFNNAFTSSIPQAPEDEPTTYSIVKLVDSAAVTRPSAEPQHAGFEKSQVSSNGTAGAAPQIDRLWTGRMDPFIKYPIETNHRTLQLIDHGKSKPYRTRKLGNP
jgi:hypothetical protein